MSSSRSRSEAVGRRPRSASVPPTRCRRRRSAARRSTIAACAASALPARRRQDDVEPVDAVGRPAPGRPRPRPGRSRRSRDLRRRRLGQHDRRVGAAGREGLGEPLGGRDRLGRLEELVGLRQPGSTWVSPVASASTTRTAVTAATDGPGAATTWSPTRRHSERGVDERRLPDVRAPAARTPSGRRARARTGSTTSAKAPPPRRRPRRPGRARGWSGTPRAAGSAGRPRPWSALASTGSAVRRTAVRIAA